MLKIVTSDFRSEVEHDLQDDYPEEVLESEWNPVIAQMQRLKRQRQEIQQQAVPLWLSSIPEMKIED